MKDCSNNIRTQYLSTLNGNISYNGKNVPVYGTDTFSTVPENYIIIGDITETADNNNQLFVSGADVVDMGDAEFQIYATARTSSRYLTMQEGNNFINRKILIINNSIIQK